MVLKSETKTRNRKLLGDRIRAAREQLGMIQQDLADKVGRKLMPHPSIVSQLELGSVTMKPPLWVPIGKALGFELGDWLAACLYAYDERAYHALYGNAARARIADSLAEFHK